jgi:hypothetical protein
MLPEFFILFDMLLYPFMGNNLLSVLGWRTAVAFLKATDIMR